MPKILTLLSSVIIGMSFISCASGVISNEEVNKPSSTNKSNDRTIPTTPPILRLEKNMSKTIQTLLSLNIPDLYTKYVDLKTLEILDYKGLISRLKGIQVIYIAEEHTNDYHHKLQEDVLRGLFQNNPKTTLSMEFLYRSRQEIIDNYSAGKIGDEEFDKKVIFGFGSLYHYYKPLIRYAQTNKIKIIGMNVEKTIKRKFVDSGWDKLTPEEQKVIARDVDTSNKEHKKFVIQSFEGMLKENIFSPEMIDKLYLMQCIWDETFAEAIANYLKSVNDPSVQVVVVAGAGHISYKFNIPERSYKRHPATYRTLIPFEIDDNTKEKERFFTDALTSNIGDFIYFSPPTSRK
ncbi:MAG: ChaN family lipoprotein [Planctomycetota bacterium]|nr:ChaN family lipoprotein [Planctomycetota bacterium]MDI6787943.1 ChaN family lipoprotein [Planctomycetota bacterium]